ncbi:phosphoribosyl-AMP cyclohydrolase [Hamadaea tsunoensis]|uniref:phosphoribosyl-AMP cyclohydrolase n=1 Tax=Hamadaea tsunoensis TaxID=53368 RepID=UPI000A039913|nr:phosphoribosyl-AMP cyclohydrolase [Hamadaea tsunoensis]
MTQEVVRQDGAPQAGPPQSSPPQSSVARGSAPGAGGRGTGVSSLDPAIAARLKRDEHGLVAAVVQRHGTGEVLMLAWMDDEALARTLATGRATYWSRSRGEYWVKGETSGHAQYVRGVAIDCDGDALLVSVDQVGAACHTGEPTCFYTDLPVTDLPVTDLPVTDLPVTELPVTELPGAELPATEPSA